MTLLRALGISVGCGRTLPSSPTNSALFFLTNVQLVSAHPSFGTRCFASHKHQPLYIQQINPILNERPESGQRKQLYDFARIARDPVPDVQRPHAERKSLNVQKLSAFTCPILVSYCPRFFGSTDAAPAHRCCCPEKQCERTTALPVPFRLERAALSWS